MPKKLILILLPLMYGSKLNAQKMYYVWEGNGKFLFQESDSNRLLDKLRNDKLAKPYRWTISPIIIEYYVLTNPQPNIIYSNLKLTIMNPFSLLPPYHNDSLDNLFPVKDSFPDGIWLEYWKGYRNSIYLLEINEVKNYKKHKYNISFVDSSFYMESFYNEGFPVGVYKSIRNGLLKEEYKYKDSLNFKIYKKYYNKEGKLSKYLDYQNGYIYKYYPNGQIERKCKIDKYGRLYGNVIFYSENGKLLGVKESNGFDFNE